MLRGRDKLALGPAQFVMLPRSVFRCLGNASKAIFFWLWPAMCIYRNLWGDSMFRTCAGGYPVRSKCQILMRYGRYPFGFWLRKLSNEPMPKNESNLLSTLTATLLLIHCSSCCCSGSSLMRLSNGCLPSASRLLPVKCVKIPVCGWFWLPTTSQICMCLWSVRVGLGLSICI